MFEAKGLITPVLTALDENEKFNPIAYKDFINMLIESGVHGIFPLGTNGEFYAFNNDEKYEIIKNSSRSCKWSCTCICWYWLRYDKKKQLSFH